MPLRDLLPNQLVYFSYVYRLRSYATAAKAIPMTKQGLTRAISRLEQNVGGPLFTETNGSLTPTSQADILYDFALHWLNDIGDLQQALFDGLEDSPVVEFAATIGSAALFDIDYVDKFQDINSSIHIAHKVLSDWETDEALLKGTVTVAITANPFNALFRTIPLRSVDMCAFVPKDNPLSAKEQIKPSDLDGQPITIIGDICKLNPMIMQALESAGSHPSKIIPFYELASKRGCGMIVVIADHLADQLRDDPSTVRLPFIAPGVVRKFGISTLREHALTPTERTFIDYLLAECRYGHSLTPPRGLGRGKPP